MYTIEILEDNDDLGTTQEGLFCRPKYPNDYSYGESPINTIGQYGNPVNNFKWVPVADMFGELWFEGKNKVKDLEGYFIARGNIPIEDQFRS